MRVHLKAIVVTEFYDNYSVDTNTYKSDLDLVMGNLCGLDIKNLRGVAIAANDLANEYEERKKRAEAHDKMMKKYLKTCTQPHNTGGHFYPGCENPKDFFTSDCKYCECWMGSSNSDGPDGVDQFGVCPGNGEEP